MIHSTLSMKSTQRHLVRGNYCEGSPSDYSLLA
jgi:hypothetical protein